VHFRRPLFWRAAAFALLLLPASSLFAQTTVLDFENLPQAPLIAQYSSQGVTFNGAAIRN